MDSYSSVTVSATSPSATKRILRPQSAPYKMFQRYQLQDSSRVACSSRASTMTSHASRSPSASHQQLRRYVQSAPQLLTSSSAISRPSSRVSQDYHRSRCAAPEPHDFTSANTVSTINGPNTSTDSLLTNKPRRAAQSARAPLHTSAWYHVPGRYSTSEHPYPPKRSQQRVHDAHRKLVKNLHTRSHSRLLLTSTFPTYIRGGGPP